MRIKSGGKNFRSSCVLRGWPEMRVKSQKERSPLLDVADAQGTNRSGVPTKARFRIAWFVALSEKKTGTDAECRADGRPARRWSLSLVQMRREARMKFVLIIWFVSKAAIAVTSAQFETVEQCRNALSSVQHEFPGEAIQVGGGCYQATAKP